MTQLTCTFAERPRANQSFVTVRWRKKLNIIVLHVQQFLTHISTHVGCQKPT